MRKSRAEAAQTVAERLLDRHPLPVIIHEIQYAPALLRHLKIWIDEHRKRAGRRTAVAQG